MDKRVLMRICRVTLTSSALALVLGVIAGMVQPIQAQVDWGQALRDATILQGEETFIKYPNGTFYVAVNGRYAEGVQKIGKGSYELGNGSYVIGADGEPTDCGDSPAECQQLLEEAAASGQPEVQAATSTARGERILSRRFGLRLSRKRG